MKENARTTMNENTQQKTDQELLKRAEEDPDAFGKLLERYHNRLFYFIQRISFFGAEDREDILQNAYIKAYKNLNTFDTSMKFSTWIYQIVRNCTIDEMRKKSARPKEHSLEEEDAVKIFRSGIDIEREVISKEEGDHIRTIIETLPQKYKEVIVLRFLEEKSYEEIMDIIKKPKGTVAARINRAKKRLLYEAQKYNLGIHSK